MCGSREGVFLAFASHGGATLVGMTQQTKTKLDLPPRLSIQQAADAFGVSTKSIRRWVADGRISAYRIGSRTIRIDRDSLLAMQKPMGAAR